MYPYTRLMGSLTTEKKLKKTGSRRVVRFNMVISCLCCLWPQRSELDYAVCFCFLSGTVCPKAKKIKTQNKRVYVLRLERLTFTGKLIFGLRYVIGQLKFPCSVPNFHNVFCRILPALLGGSDNQFIIVSIGFYCDFNFNWIESSLTQCINYLRKSGFEMVTSPFFWKIPETDYRLVYFFIILLPDIFFRASF